MASGEGDDNLASAVRKWRANRKYGLVIRLQGPPPGTYSFQCIPTPKSSQTAPPYVNQVFKQMNSWGTVCNIVWMHQPSELSLQIRECI